MAELIKTYVENAPKCKLVGKRYTNDDRRDGNYRHLWHEWFEKGHFKTLEALLTPEWMSNFPEAGSYLGFMRIKQPDTFEYWIGLFAPSDAKVPEGFDSLNLPDVTYGVGFIKGTEPQIFLADEKVHEALLEQGHRLQFDGDGCEWVVERYQHPRFTTPDEQGDKILDILMRIEAVDIAAFEPADVTGKHYCAHCRKEYVGEACPECGKKGTDLRLDDPILIGELPGRLRNALTIAFGATEIPFNALSNLGTGFTLAAGDLFESYTIYAPYERAEEAKAAFQSVFDINEEP